MMMKERFVLICFVFSFCHATHFFGGSMSWRSKSSNSSQVTIELKQSYSWLNALQPCQTNTGTSANLTCLVGCATGVTDISVNGFCVGADQGLNITRAENVAELNFPLDAQRVLAYQSTAWASLIPSATTWSLITYLNLFIRNDTGRVNSSPFSSIPPIITLPTKQKQTIRIPLFDSDGDFVRCRWSKSNAIFASNVIDECASVCGPIANTQLISSSNSPNNCSLSILLNTTGYFVVAIQLEDFSSSNSNGSILSSVPLQFIIRTVDTTCSLPKIVGEYPDGTTIQVTANTIFTTLIIARIYCLAEPIDRFMTITSPSGLSTLSHAVKHNITHYYSRFTWFASIDDVGTIQMFCTAAIDTQEFSSTQYCLNFQIIAPTTTTTTTTTTMTTTTTELLTTRSTFTESNLPLAWILGLGIPLFLLGLISAYLCYSKWCSKSFRGRFRDGVDEMTCPKCQNHRYELSELSSNQMSTRPISPFDISSITNTTTSLMDPVVNTSLTPIDGSHLVRVFTRQQVWPEKKS